MGSLPVDVREVNLTLQNYKLIVLEVMAMQRASAPLPPTDQINLDFAITIQGTRPSPRMFSHRRSLRVSVAAQVPHRSFVTPVVKYRHTSV